MPLHEWKSFETQDVLTDKVITWIFEEDSYSPIAKIKNDKQYSIVNDHLGTPIEAYAEDGKSIWERELNSNGKVLKEKGNVGTCPFLFQGQYYDEEIVLAYNRFRYYDPEEGRYISQDPIGLLSGEFGFYNYVEDTNGWIDVFGWSKSYARGKERLEKFRKKFKGNIENLRHKGHIDKHGMSHDQIREIINNLDNIYYHDNNNHVLFYKDKDGDVVVVSGKDSGFITAYGKSSSEGISKPLSSITDKPAFILIE